MAPDFSKGIFIVSGQKIIEDLCAQADITINGNRPWDLKIRNQAFYDRVLADGSLGIGEAYIYGRLVGCR